MYFVLVSVCQLILSLIILFNTLYFTYSYPKVMSRGKIDAKVKTLSLQCCAWCNFQVIRLIVTEGLNTLDQIAFNAFHTFLVEVQVKAGGYQGAMYV